MSTSFLIARGPNVEELKNAIFDRNNNHTIVFESNKSIKKEFKLHGIRKRRDPNEWELELLPIGEGYLVKFLYNTQIQRGYNLDN